MAAEKAAPASAGQSGDRRGFDLISRQIEPKPTESLTEPQRTDSAEAVNARLVREALRKFDNGDLEGGFELLPPPPLKVLHAEPSGTSGIHHAQMIFFGASENVLHKIRRWVYSHGASYLRNG